MAASVQRYEPAVDHSEALDHLFSPKAQDPCSICLSEMALREIKKLGCNHKFHEACVDRWLEAHDICPLCRAVDPGAAQVLEARARGAEQAAPPNLGLIPELERLVANQLRHLGQEAVIRAGLGLGQNRPLSEVRDILKDAFREKLQEALDEGLRYIGAVQGAEGMIRQNGRLFDQLPVFDQQLIRDELGYEKETTELEEIIAEGFSRSIAHQEVRRARIRKLDWLFPPSAGVFALAVAPAPPAPLPLPEVRQKLWLRIREHLDSRLRSGRRIEEWNFAEFLVTCRSELNQLPPEERLRVMNEMGGRAEENRYMELAQNILRDDKAEIQVLKEQIGRLNQIISVPVSMRMAHEVRDRAKRVAEAVRGIDLEFAYGYAGLTAMTLGVGALDGDGSFAAATVRAILSVGVFKAVWKIEQRVAQCIPKRAKGFVWPVLLAADLGVAALGGAGVGWLYGRDLLLSAAKGAGTLVAHSVGYGIGYVVGHRLKARNNPHQN